MIHYFIRINIFALALLLSQTVVAATFSISTPTSNGTFTVSWSDARTFAELHEVVNGSRQKIGEYPKTHSITYQKPPGTYIYIFTDVLAFNCPTCPGGAGYQRAQFQ